MPCRVPKRRFSCGAPQHLTKNQKKGVRRNLHSFARPLTFLACFLRQCSHDIVCFMDIGAADRSFSRKDEERIAGKDT